MIRKIIIFLSLLITANTFAQKGIFKKGMIKPLKYNEELIFKIKDDHIFVNVEINGKTYRFLLDTGAPTVFGNNVIGNFKNLEEIETGDAGGNSQTVKYVMVEEMKLGNITYHNFAAGYGDLGGFEYLGIDGILGSNLIVKSVWDFDLANKKITISDHLDKNIIKGFQKTKTKILNTGTPTFTITYFGKMEEKNIYFDTGYNGLFYLCYPIFQKISNSMNIENIAEGNGFISKNAFGDSEGKTYLLPLEMTIGKENIPVFISDVDYDEESNLGAKWLAYYRTIVEKNNFYFKENGRQMKKEFVTNGINIDEQDGNLLVVFVWQNSSAYKMGIKVGDKILSVNGKNVDTNDSIGLKKIYDEINNKEKVNLEINTKNNFVELKKEILLRVK